jgi:galactose mutarotase-like enzyme
MTRTTIASSELEVGIDSLGAQLRSLRFEGTELLWQAGDPWHYSAPVLFPLISRLPGNELHHRGASYPIASHGVARISEFALTDSDDDTATFCLTADAATKAAYPFDFELYLTFQVFEGELSVTHLVVNTGDEALPFLLGAHPAFQWPLPGAEKDAEHTVTWATGGTSMRQAVNGLLPGRFASPAVDGRLVLRRELFADDAVLFDDIEPRQVAYTADGAPRVTVSYDDFPRFGVWSKAEGGDFVCLEPWSGYPAAADFDGDVIDLPEAEVLVPGEERMFTYLITVEKD